MLRLFFIFISISFLTSCKDSPLKKFEEIPSEGFGCSFSNSSDFVCGTEMMDTRDNQIYETVWIDIDGGNDITKDGQCWMKENLRYIPIPSSNEIGERICYDSIESNCDIYGGYYTWNTATQNDAEEYARGICPEGWRIPIISDFEDLMRNVGTASNDLGAKFTNECSGNNSSQFTADFNGFLNKNGGFEFHINDRVDCDSVRAKFWSSTMTNNINAHHLLIFKNSTNSIAVEIDPSNISNGLNVRCICDR